MKIPGVGPSDVPSKSGLPPAILWGGLISGVLDILVAFTESTLRGGNPVRLSQGIASALLGPIAFKGGFITAALGLAMHFSVAFSAAAIFFQASRNFPQLIRHAVLAGLFYGALVYFVMKYAVVPLAKLVRSVHLGEPFLYDTSPIAWFGLMVHLVFVGLPIALAARQFRPLASNPEK